MMPDATQQMNDVRLTALEAAIDDLEKDNRYLKACLEHHGLLIATDEEEEG